MADNAIDNLSIEVVASADKAIQMFERLASSADRLRSAASSTANSLRDEADAAVDAGTETQQAGQQARQAAKGVSAFWTSIRRAGSVIGGGFVNAVRNAHKSLTGFITGIARIAKFRIYRTIIKDLGQSFKDLYGYSDAFGIKFADSMDKITTAVIYLRNSIAAMTAPLVNALAPVIDLIIDKIVEALNLFNEFLAAITGASTFTVAKKIAVSFGDAISSSGKKAKKAADDIKRTILGFDEINKLVAPKDNTGKSSGSSPYSDNYKLMFEERNVSSGLKNMSAAIEKSLSSSLSRMDTILSGGSLAVGALLAFSGANVPLGLALMANGAAGLAKQITANWGGLDSNVREVIGRIEPMLIGAELAVGALLAFSGTNVPVGLSLMAAGVVTAAKSIVWGGLLTGGIDNVLKNILAILGGASLAIGAVLAFTGANIPVGIGLMAAGIATTGTSLLWGGGITGPLQNVLKNIAMIASGASLAIGALLAFTGVSVPLGIALIAAGITGVGASIVWGGALTSGITNVLNNIGLLVSGAQLAIGAILTFTGTNIPLGIGLMAMGITGVATSLSWGSGLTGPIQNTLNTIRDILSAGNVVVGAILAFSGVATPLGIAMMASGLATGIGTRVDWDALGNKIKTKWDEIKTTTETKWEQIKTSIKTAWDGAITWTSSKVAAIKTSATTAWATIKTNTSNNWDSIKSTVSEKWNEMKENASTAFSNISTSVSDAWENAKTKLSSFASWISDTFSGDWKNAWSKVVNFFSEIFGTVKDKAKEPINGIIDFINSLIGKVEKALNRIRRGISNAVVVDIPSYDMPWPIPDTPAIYWKPINLQDVELKRIQPLAKGGILDKSALLGFNGLRPVIGGEAGREAVLPLDSNTEWMDDLSNRVIDRASDGYSNSETYSDNSAVVQILREVRTLLLQINEKEFVAEVTTSSINNAQRRTNRRMGMTVVPVSQ